MVFINVILHVCHHGHAPCTCRKQNSDVLVEAGGPSKQGEEPAAEEAQGAWSGWVELPASAAAAAAAGGGEGREGDGAGGEKKDSEEADEGEKEGDVQDEEEEGGELGLTEEELMHQLGLKLEKVRNLHLSYSPSCSCWLSQLQQASSIMLILQEWLSGSVLGRTLAWLHQSGCVL